MVIDAGQVISKPMSMCPTQSLSINAREEAHFQFVSRWRSGCVMCYTVRGLSVPDRWTLPAALADSNKWFHLEDFLK